MLAHNSISYSLWFIGFVKVILLGYIVIPIVFYRLRPNINSYDFVLVTIKSTIILKESSMDKGTYFNIPITGELTPLAKVMLLLVLSMYFSKPALYNRSSEIRDILAPVSTIPFVSIPYILQGM